MAHIALYREFRPQRFSDVVGQEHITRTLRNALVQGRLHHAYLLSGPRGTGKTTVARILAKAVNCLNLRDGEPCNECEPCRRITSGQTMDIIEIDAASNRGIDEIRDLRDKVKYAPVDLKYKVYIIDEVHMLSEPAFNALLKTLEEPPAHVLFVLATTEKQKLPITILSRCQAFDYHRLSTEEIVKRLQEVCATQGMKASSEALAAMARQADGGMRDALSLLDQVMAYAADGEITLEMTLAVLGSAPLDQFLRLDGQLAGGDVGGALLWLDEMVRTGKDLRQLVRDYLAHLRDLLLVKVDSGGQVLNLPPQALAQVREQAAQFTQDRIISAIRLLGQSETELRLSASPRLLVEVALIRLAALFTCRDDEARADPVDARPAAPAGSAAQRRSSARGGGAPATGAAATGQQVAGQFGSGAQVADTVAPGRQAGDRAASAGQAAFDPQATDGAESAPGTPGAGPVPGGAAGQPPLGPEADRVAQAWERVLELVRKHRPSTYNLLSNSARIGGLRGSLLYIVATSPVFAQLLRRPQDKAIVEKALERAGMAGLTVEILAPDEAQAKLAGLNTTAPAAPPPASGGSPGAEGGNPGAAQGGDNPLMDRLRSLFPPDVIHEIEEEDS